MYNRLVLIGPFFQESRIKTSPHLYVSYYDNNLWTPPRDYALENFSFYSGHPWRYGKLRMNYYDRYISNKVGQLNETMQLSDVKDSQAFRELHQFVMEEYLKRPVDSIALVYGLNHYVPQTNSTRFDTTFAYTYNPAEIAPAKLVY